MEKERKIRKESSINYKGKQGKETAIESRDIRKQKGNRKRTDI